MVSEGLPNLGLVSLWERTLSRLRRAPSLESDHLRKKPSNLLYDVDEVPPLAVRMGVSLQHIFLMSLGWLYVVVIVNAVGGTTAEAQSLIRISMVASGLATIIQARRSSVGSGYPLCAAGVQTESAAPMDFLSLPIRPICARWTGTRPHPSVRSHPLCRLS